MISGVVEAINLSDENDAVNTIWVATTNKGRNLIKASPLSMNVRYIPILGEMVYLVKAATDESSGTKNSEKYYYLSPVAVHRNINHNAIPPFLEMEGGGTAGYEQAAAGVANSSSPSTDVDLGRGFVELNTLPQLQGFLGDIIFEGRFGQSIRFGYTPKGVTTSDNKISAVKKQPSWTSTKPESPITILRNGVTTNDGYNKLVIEDINKDASSIWLTDQQKVNITLSSTLPVGITPSSLWSKPQVIVNSDRIVINSKKDNIILASKKDIVVTTATNTTTIDKIIEAITILAQGLYPTAVGPTGPHPQIAQIIAKLKQGI